MRGKAFRRHQVARAKARAHRTCKHNWYWYLGSTTGREIGIMATTRKRCSCTGCGNPRRHFGEITRQEKRAKLGDWSVHEQLDPSRTAQPHKTRRTKEQKKINREFRELREELRSEQFRKILREISQ